MNEQLKIALAALEKIAVWHDAADDDIGACDEPCAAFTARKALRAIKAPADAAPSVAPEPLHVDETKRYRVVQKGYWWRVQIGDGQQTVGRCFSQTEAQHLAHALVVAYRDGFFVASQAAHPPRAPLTVPMPPQNKCCRDEAAWQDGWIAGWEAAHGIGGK